MLTKENLEELKRNLAHLSLSSVREFYQRAHDDCRLIHELPSPKKIQTLVTIWKQLWKGGDFGLISTSQHIRNRDRPRRQSAVDLA